MYKGKFWLDFEDDEEEETWDAEIDRCVIREDGLVLEFSGHDQDAGPFRGFCQLVLDGARYVGGGTFVVLSKFTEANVSLILDKTKKPFELIGNWQPVGSSRAYNLYAELEQVAQ